MSFTFTDHILATETSYAQGRADRHLSYILHQPKTNKYTGYRLTDITALFVCNIFVRGLNRLRREQRA
jgi:hypothetical protein